MPLRGASRVTQARGVAVGIGVSVGASVGTWAGGSVATGDSVATGSSVTMGSWVANSISCVGVAVGSQAARRRAMITRIAGFVFMESFPFRGGFDTVTERRSLARLKRLPSPTQPPGILVTRVYRWLSSPER